MENLWSIRIRASKEVKRQKSKVKRQNSKLETQNSKLTEVHISGAEGIYEGAKIQGIVKKYIGRALSHPKGKADKVIITIEAIKQRPKTISAPPVATVRCSRVAEGKNTAVILLQSLGISKSAIDIAFELIKKGGMRGAAIISVKRGARLEPDKERGVRVSRLGINKLALKVLSSRLSKYGINTDTVKEALILAAKVVSFKDVIAELCVSDNPSYTTGYVASKEYGYVRIPSIKRKGSKSGGRAFFVKDGIDVERIIRYLERMPVIIGKVGLCKGIMSLDEIINHPHQ